MDVFPFCFEWHQLSSRTNGIYVHVPTAYICFNQNHICALIVLNDAQPELYIIYGADKLYGWMVEKKWFKFN